MKNGKEKSIRGKHLPESVHPRVNTDVDFGTYHHSTPEESEALRKLSKAAFSTLLKDLYPSDAPLQILDAGCGLGFLMDVAAKCFPAAHITGVDLFSHNSMSEMSIAKAKRNMKSLALDSRTSFVKHDLTKALATKTQYDLAVSNVVFHNMGKKRFKAYETVFNVIKPGGFFVIGDLFPHQDTDMDYFREHSSLLKELNEGNYGAWVYRIRVLRVNQ